MGPGAASPATTAPTIDADQLAAAAAAAAAAACMARDATTAAAEAADSAVLEDSTMGGITAQHFDIGRDGAEEWRDY